MGGVTVSSVNPLTAKPRDVNTWYLVASSVLMTAPHGTTNNILLPLSSTSLRPVTGGGGGDGSDGGNGGEVVDGCGDGGEVFGGGGDGGKVVGGMH